MLFSNLNIYLIILFSSSKHVNVTIKVKTDL